MGETGELAKIRRLRLRTLLRGRDDLDVNVSRTVRPEVATRAVRRLRRRGWVVLLAGLVGCVGAVTVADVMTARSEALLAAGDQTPAVVVGTNERTRFSAGTISVRYTAGGVERVGEINLNDSSPAYHVGDQVTVVYDPADPGRLRTPEEENDPTWAVILFAILLVFGLLLVGSGVGAVVRWQRRVRSARAHGWRPGRAEVRDVKRGSALLDIWLAGEWIQVRTTRPVAYPFPYQLSLSDIQLGGTGRALVVVLHTGPFVMAAKPWKGQPRHGLTAIPPVSPWRRPLSPRPSRIRHSRTWRSWRRGHGSGRGR
ncbi:MAG: DUF3592 domain-containing protein [Labedaea sp.]